MRMYQRRRQLTPEETARNAAERAAREAAAMTCQICGRKILANTGTIAHHGYERPYDGWQTSSCYGAKHLPFESDSKVLVQYITMLEGVQNNLVLAHANVKDELVPASFSYEKRVNPGMYPERKELVMVTVTRADFAQKRAKHEQTFVRRGYHDFEKVQASHLARIEYEQRQVLADLVHQRTRLKDWQLTHRFTGETWVKL